MHISTAMQPLHLNTGTFRILLELQGPSLGLWRAAEIAALREQSYEHPVLDLGCGDGLVTSLVLPHVEIGVDPNEKVLVQASHSGTYERFEAIPIEKTQLPDNSISTVVSNSVLEHIADIDTALATIARILRPGGRLIFTTPTPTFSQWLAFPLRGYAERRNRELCHLNLWSAECWAMHLAQVGLEVEFMRPYLGQQLVRLWDMLELLQHIWIGRHRLWSIFWLRIPPRFLTYLATRAAQIDLAANAASGGQLIVAHKKEG
jgi:SAM-dependent methyltransferase